MAAKLSPKPPNRLLLAPTEPAPFLSPPSALQKCREVTFPVAKVRWGEYLHHSMTGEDMGEPRKILVPSCEYDPPVPCHRHTKGESAFLQRRVNDSQFFVVGIIQGCPLVLLMWLPLYRLVVGIQVGAVQAVVVLNQACREGKIPVSITPTRAFGCVRAEGSDWHCVASLKLARAPPRA